MDLEVCDAALAWRNSLICCLVFWFEILASLYDFGQWLILKALDLPFLEQQDGCIVCPSTESTYDLKTGKVKDWMPTNPVLRVLTPSLRDLQTYSVKIESESIYINVAGRTGESAEIVFGGTTQAGKTATNVDVDEVTISC